MKKIAGILKENWKVLLLSVFIIVYTCVTVGIGIRHILTTSEPTVEMTQEEFELELIHVDLQKHYNYRHFQRLDYKIIEVIDGSEIEKVYLLTYLVYNDGENEIRTYAATVERDGDTWDVDTERIYYK